MHVVTLGVIGEVCFFMNLGHFYISAIKYMKNNDKTKCLSYSLCSTSREHENGIPTRLTLTKTTSDA